MRAVVVVFAAALAGCAVRAPRIAATHPASPDAPVGRLAGAPPSLRAGVVEYKDVPAMREGPAPDAGHHHHHHHE